MWPRQVNPSDENDSATAPYNFVPLNDHAVTVRTECLPDQDVYHADRYTGTIVCTLTTETPTFVRAPLTLDEYRQTETSAEKELPYYQRAKNKPDFFYTDAAKTPRIPGSTLRGMLRTLVEIASYGRFDSVTARSLIYRAVGEPTSHGDSYRNLIMQQDDGVPGPPAYTPRAKAGYIKQLNGEWRIFPAKEEVSDATFTRINYHQLDPIKAHLAKAAGCKNTRDIWVKPGLLTYHRMNKDRVQIRFSQVEQAAVGSEEGLVKAVLVESGLMPRNQKHSEAVVFACDSTAAPLEVGDDLIRTYCDQLTEKQKDLLGNDGVLSSPNELQPVFYLLDDNGKVLFFGHTMMMRLPYANSVADYVPAALREGSTDLDVDMAQAVFGYTRGKGQGKARSYASRVFVGDAVLKPDQESIWWVNSPITPRILSGPKPTTFQHYLVQQRPDKVQIGHSRPRRPLSSYAAATPRETVLRGHKLYWHKKETTLDQVQEPIRITNPVRDTQHTRMKPVNANVRFRTELRFENLAKEELGALLWALRLPGAEGRQYRHKLGMGKPYGLGTVRIELHDTDLILENRCDRYANLFDAGENGLAWHTGVKPPAAGEGIDDFVASFELHVLKQCGEPAQKRLVDTPRIRSLFKLLEWPGPENAKIQYMALEDFRRMERAVLPDPLFVTGERGRPQRPGHTPGGGGQTPSHSSTSQPPGSTAPDVAARSNDRPQRRPAPSRPAPTPPRQSSIRPEDLIDKMQGRAPEQTTEPPTAPPQTSPHAPAPSRPATVEDLKPGLYVEGTVTAVQQNGVEVDLGPAAAWLAKEHAKPRDMTQEALTQRFPIGKAVRGWIMPPNKKGRLRMSMWPQSENKGGGA